MARLILHLSFPTEQCLKNNSYNLLAKLLKYIEGTYTLHRRVVVEQENHNKMILYTLWTIFLSTLI